VVNPLDIIEEYGADALRFALSGAACGKQHMRFSLNNVEQSQHFMNKIWNIVRFAHGRGVMAQPHCPQKIQEIPQIIQDPLNQWMVFQVSEMLDQMQAHIGAYRFSDAARTVYHFIWNVVCDWYVEWAKREWDHPERGAEVQRVFLWILGVSVRIVHPFMPFITEKIWHDLTGEKGTLCQTEWPKCMGVDNDTTRAFSGMHDMIVLMRRVRSLFVIPAGQALDVVLWTDSAQLHQCITQYHQPLSRWLNVSCLQVHVGVQAEASSGVVFPMPGLGALVVALSGVVDMSVAAQHVHKELEKIEKEYAILQKRLSDFENQPLTPEEIIQDVHMRCEEKRPMIAYMRTTLEAIETSSMQ